MSAAEEKELEPGIEAEASRPSFESIEIHDESSIVTDHTTYCENIDGFVLRALHACASTACSPRLGDLPMSTDAGTGRARWRVNHLRLAWWLLTIASLTAPALLLIRFHESWALSFGLPEWSRPLDLVLLF
jgi:hypothetical protein